MTAFEWASAQTGIIPRDDVYCQTRDVAQARVSRLDILLPKAGWDEEQTALITSIVGEVANNCFDHNIGQWKDVPGCWLEYVIERNVFKAIVADRGQGIFGSLLTVRPKLRSHGEALHLAFTEAVSGRAPEKRGNGLKFVVHSLNQLSPAYFIMCSGDAKIALTTPVDTAVLDQYIVGGQLIIVGTYAEMDIPKL